MNILEAYLIQKGKLTVVFSSPDENLLKEIIYNLLKDFGAEMLNLYPYLKDMDNIDNRLVEKLFKIENKVIFIIGPAFPTNYIKGLKFNYHISISLSKSLSIERGVDKSVFKVNEEYNEEFEVYLNLFSKVHFLMKLKIELKILVYHHY